MPENIFEDISLNALEEVKINILKEVLKTVINAINKTIKMNNIEIEYDKKFTKKFLNNTVESIFEKMNQEDNETFYNDLITKFKQTNTIQKSIEEIKHVFSPKKMLMNTNNSDVKDEIPLNNFSLSIPNVVYFCKNIPDAIELPKNIFNVSFKLQKNVNKYHIFTVKLIYENKIYYITYAELNKYTKREIIAIYLNNDSISQDDFPIEIKEKYDFY